MTDIESEPDEAREEYPSEVSILELEGGRTVVLVGTAHVSRESVDLVRLVIERERPDRVCVELDEQRYKALSEEQRWEKLDLRQVIRKKQLSTLIANLILGAYQKRLGMQLGVTPGAELLEAVQAAEERDIPVSLCDREIRVTLRRTWKSLGPWQKFQLMGSLLAATFEEPELSEEDLRKLRQQDVLSEMMRELGEALPSVKRVLIDERDGYLAEKIRLAEGQRLVAVVGAGHVEGMKRALESSAVTDLEALEQIPPVSPVWRWVGWAIPAVILGSIAYIGWTKGASAAGDNAMFWFLANAVPCAIGGVVALGHPATILAAFLAAPFTSLTPVIGAGYVAAFVQTWFKPPLVAEFQSVGEDLSGLRGWYRSRLLRIFLVFILTSIGSLIGSWVGLVEILSNLF